MLDLLTSNEIVRHRALGLSFTDIAEVVGVSKPTVIKVCNGRIDDIADAKEIASEVAKADVARSISKRRAMFGKILDGALRELLARAPSEMSTKELLSLVQVSERHITQLEERDGSPPKIDVWKLKEANAIALEEAKQTLQRVES